MRTASLLLLALPVLAGDLALDGLTHVALRVSDVAASRAFYEKLGFEQAFEFSDAKGVTTSYMKVNDRQFIELYRRNKPEEALGLMHLCFDTSGLDALVETYKAAGLNPTDHRKARAGNLLFNLRDPENTLIEYTQYLPGSLHSNDRGKHMEQRPVTSHMLAAAAPAKDVAAIRAFYKEKLGFTDLGGKPVRLVFPGKSGEEVELDAAAPDWKPRLVFEVAAPKAEITDPDGTRIVFRAVKH